MFACVWCHPGRFNVWLWKLMKILLSLRRLVVLLLCSRIVKLVRISYNFIGLGNRTNVWLLSLTLLNHFHHHLHIFHHSLLFLYLTLLLLFVFIVSHANKLFHEHLEYVVAILKFKTPDLLQVINLNNVGVNFCC